jgi:hypothetical protein
MYKKKIHTNVKINFPDPYVIRLEYKGDSSTLTFNDFKKQVYKSVQGTWGYSPLKIASDMYNFNFPISLASYWCFKDKTDALMFTLLAGEKASRVFIWPATTFTIHEEVEFAE